MPFLLSVSHFPSTLLMVLKGGTKTRSWKLGSYNDTNTSPFPPLQTLPYRHPCQFDRMAHIHIDLLIPLLLLGILPKVRKRRFEHSRADAVRVRYVVPFLLADLEESGKIGPVRYVGLHEEDVIAVGGVAFKVGCCADVGDEDFGAEGG
jgi:hypothetical protein